MELHFYPGQKLLSVKIGGVVKRYFEAWGGPSSRGRDPHMQEIPTTAGTYIIHSIHPYSTPSWAMSKIKWGVALKDMPHKKDVWYKLSNGKWGSVKNDVNISRDEIMDYYYRLYGRRLVPQKWVFNDFGPISLCFRLFLKLIC